MLIDKLELFKFLLTVPGVGRLRFLFRFLIGKEGLLPYQWVFVWLVSGLQACIQSPFRVRALRLALILWSFLPLAQHCSRVARVDSL